jgi:hypothetical protein
MCVGGQRYAPLTLPPRKTWYQPYSRLVEPQGRSGRVRKIPAFPPCTGIRVAMPTELSRPTEYLMFVLLLMENSGGHLLQLSHVTHRFRVSAEVKIERTPFGEDICTCSESGCL